MSKCVILLKKHYFFLWLIPIIIYIQLELLKLHLKFGFSDVDWGFLAFYYKNKLLFPNFAENFYHTFLTWGVYAHQSYYIGIMGDFFGLDFQSFQFVTNTFKILATIASYPLFYVITRSRVTATLGVILFAFAYPAVGAMYTTVTSSDYTAVLSAVIFLWLYWVVIERKRNSLILNFSLLILFMLTLFLSTERMYPLVGLLVFSEIFLLMKNRFSKVYLRLSIWRIIILFSPVFIVLAIFPSMVFSFLSANGVNLLKSIQEGDLVQLLRPFLALGSLIIPSDYWKYFGIVKIDNINNYLVYFFQGPFISFVVLTVIIGLLIFKNKYSFIVQTLIAIFVMAILVFVFRIHNKNLLDMSMFTPILIGGYIFVLGLISSIHWFKYQQDERMLVGFFLGIISAFFYILMNWMGSDIYLNFSGVHRYLTVSALAICLSLGSLLALIIKKLKERGKFARMFSYTPLLILVPIIYIWSSQITYYFNDQLNQGFGAEEQQFMRKQLMNLTSDLSSKESSLFYFDFSEDANRGYYYDNTLMGGFNTWILWHPNINFKENLKPYAFWNNINRLKSSYTITKNGEAGFNINEKFYLLNNFYAFKLKDRKVVDIKDKVLEEIVF